MKSLFRYNAFASSVAGAFSPPALDGMLNRARVFYRDEPLPLLLKVTDPSRLLALGVPDQVLAIGMRIEHPPL